MIRSVSSVQRHVGEEQRRQAVGQLALVADVGHVERGQQREAR